MERREFLRQLALLSACSLGGVRSATAAAATDAGPIVLNAAPSSAAFFDEAPTPLWTFGGQTPGPLIRARQGDMVRARLVNGLPEATTVHWHGIRIRNDMDGVPGLTQAPTEPGAEFDYAFTVPDAGTYWYHSHHRSWSQVARGLYGILIVDEPAPPPVDQDLVFVLDDWRIGDDYQLDEASFGSMHDASHAGRLGNWATVNGQFNHEMAVRSGERVRLRIVNTANSRVFELRFDRHEPIVIALDGQPVSSPYALPNSMLEISPGQRVDLIVDMQLSPGDAAPISVVFRDDEAPVSQFSYTSTERLTRDLPPVEALPENPLDRNIRLDSAKRVPLLMEGGAMGRMREARYQGEQRAMRDLIREGMVWAMNGEVGQPEAPLVRVPRGTTVQFDMTNQTAWPHAMHVHGHHFQVVERDGQPVNGAPWRDTELALPGESVSCAFVADNPGKWLLHCHMLEHSVSGMLTWFEVV